MKEDHVTTSSSSSSSEVGGAGCGGRHKRLGSESSSSSSEDARTESPGVQLMERESDGGSEEEEEGHYRFPSSVFSRTKSSNTGKEWSINSNESLFSIHMNSFNKDLSWIAKSGELGGKNGEPLPLGEGGGKRKTTTKLDEGLCATPEAVETMKSILMENSAAAQRNPVLPSSPSLPRRSTESRDSTTSFAFPILTGNQSLKKSRQTAQKQREELAVENSKQQTPKAGPDPPPPPPPATAQTQTKWFGCFTCCSGGTS